MTEFEEVKEQALALSPKERAKLAEQLLESLESPSESELEALWHDEIKRRIERVECGESKLYSLEEAIGQARKAVHQET